MGRKIKILRVVTRLNVGGPSRHIRLLMQGLPAERFEQRLVTGRLAEGEEELADAGAWVRDRLPELGRSITPVQDLQAYRRLKRIIADFEPEIIHSHQAKAGALARLAGRGGPAALVHTFHGHTFTGYWGPITGTIFRKIERRLALLSDALVVQAPSQAEDIERVLGSDLRARLRLVGPGVDFEALTVRAGNSDTLRSDLGFTTEKVLAFVARLAPVKNCAAFLRVVARLRATVRAPIVAVIAGGGDRNEEARLQELVDELELRPHVRWLGFRRDVATVLQLADVLVSTSINEGTPLGLLEGLWCGTPVAAFGVGGVPDLLTGLPSTRVIEPGLEEPMALSIASLLEEGKIGGEVLKGLRRDLEQKFGPDRLIADLAQLYEELAFSP